MEILVPVAIAAIGIGVLLVVLRRPTVVRPPGPTPPDAAQPTGPDKPLGTIVLRNKKTFTTSTISVGGKDLSATDIFKLAQGKDLDQLTQKLLKLVPDTASNAVPEARLAYPGATIVMIAASDMARSGSQASTDYKTTFATEATSDQVVGWYQDWLSAHGWQPDTSDGAVAGMAHDFARGSEHFRLALADPAAVRAVIAVPIPDNTRTVFEVEYRNAAAPPPS